MDENPRVGDSYKLPCMREVIEEPSLFYVRYEDHVEFRNADPSLLEESVREVIGWLVRETDKALYLCCDKAVKPLPFEKPSDSGFIILKSDVLEMKRIKIEQELGCKIG